MVKDSPTPDDTFSMSQAASHGALLVLSCKRCDRTATFLALDLLRLDGLVDPKKSVYAPPFPCNKCGGIECVSVSVDWPRQEDFGKRIIRRPGPVRKVQTWVNVKLSPNF